jgi:hypothetical protein
MSDISFSCPSCLQHIACDDAYRCECVSCPTCGNGVLVPPRGGPSGEIVRPEEGNTFGSGSKRAPPLLLRIYGWFYVAFYGLSLVLLILAAVGGRDVSVIGFFVTVAMIRIGIGLTEGRRSSVFALTAMGVLFAGVIGFLLFESRESMERFLGVPGHAPIVLVSLFLVVLVLPPILVGFAQRERLDAGLSVAPRRLERIPPSCPEGHPPDEQGEGRSEVSDRAEPGGDRAERAGDSAATGAGKRRVWLGVAALGGCAAVLCCGVLLNLAIQPSRTSDGEEIHGLYFDLERPIGVVAFVLVLIPGMCLGVGAAYGLITKCQRISGGVGGKSSRPGVGAAATPDAPRKGSSASASDRSGVLDLRDEEELDVERRARSPLGCSLENMALSLAQLAAACGAKGDENWTEIRRVGERLDAQGGFQLMRLVCYRVAALGGKWKLVNTAWIGVGSWRG